MIADNYGDPTTCLAEVQFFGVGECKYHIMLHRVTLNHTVSLLSHSHCKTAHAQPDTHSVLHQLITLHYPLHRE